MYHTREKKIHCSQLVINFAYNCTNSIQNDPKNKEAKIPFGLTNILIAFIWVSEVSKVVI